MASFVLTYKGTAPQGNEIGLLIDICDTMGAELVSVAFAITEASVIEVARTVGNAPAADFADSWKLVMASAIRLAVRWVEQLLIGGAIRPGETEPVITERVGTRELRDHFERDKACSYRTKTGRDLFCAATSTLATVSLPICNACQLPDDAALCSHLLSPRLSIQRIGHGSSLTGPNALCNRGEDEVSSVSGCTAGGHHCWQRLVRVDAVPPKTIVSTLSLAEALDFLNATWRIAFPKAAQLLHLKVATTVAVVSQPCVTRSDFVSCCSALDDIVKLFKIDDQLLDPSDIGTPEMAGSLKRLSATLRRHIPSSDATNGERGIETLWRINRIRVGLQHSDASKDLVKHLATLGISSLADSAAAWRILTAHAVEALGDIRTALATAV